MSNRFTQIWVPSIEDQSELAAILEARLAQGVQRKAIADRLLAFWLYFQTHVSSARGGLSVRDLLAWVGFINTTAGSVGDFAAYAHGAHLTLLDGIGLGVGVPPAAAAALRRSCEDFLLSQLPQDQQHHSASAAGRIAIPTSTSDLDRSSPEGFWGIPPFFAPQGCHQLSCGSPFEVSAPTTCRNAFRVLRALQVKKAILLEGSPGVGKTSLVAALAKSLQHPLVRINLSEQTDMMDLLGADLPAPDGEPGQFTW